ncbi:hypothetical protein NDU88_007255 [Pleurodeles waltl]|uniref:Uncharacterized protein n=1 Tax=Pleurodeles waltl TaxID=8319 RepID=A0AAV7VTU0_PLEWA|nr:hypothetical protein NDU88_007255 [Pleurodeles waltl]
MQSLQSNQPRPPDWLASLLCLCREHRDLEQWLGMLDYNQYLAKPHEEVDLAGRMLAWLLNDAGSHPAIGTLWYYEGEILNREADINVTFMSFNSSLYAAVLGPSESALRGYLQELPQVEFGSDS